MGYGVSLSRGICKIIIINDFHAGSEVSERRVPSDAVLPDALREHVGWLGFEIA